MRQHLETVGKRLPEEAAEFGDAHGLVLFVFAEEFAEDFAEDFA
jgi:hypothetical protein